MGRVAVRRQDRRVGGVVVSAILGMRCECIRPILAT
jgi:hypothetical protein